MSLKNPNSKIFTSKTVAWNKITNKKLLIVDVSAVMRSNMKYLDTPENRIKGLYTYSNRVPLSYEIDGELFNTSALYGILRLFKLFKLQEDVIFCFDGAKNLRKTIDNNYKRSRVKQGNEYFDQVNSFYKMLQLGGFSAYLEEGYEGDDLINKAVIDNYDEYEYIGIVTNDKDLSHLVDEKVFILNALRKKGDIHYWNYEKELNIPYNTILLYKSLVGDSSDEYKGVKGFGKKSFEKLVSSFNKPFKKGNEELVIKSYGFTDEQESQALHCLNLAQPLIIDKNIKVNRDVDWFNLYEFCGQFGINSIQKYIEEENLLEI